MKAAFSIGGPEGAREIPEGLRLRVFTIVRR